MSCYDNSSKIKVVLKEFDQKKRPYICLNEEKERREFAKLLYNLDQYCLNLDVCQTSRAYFSMEDVEKMVEKGKHCDKSSPYYWIGKYLDCNCATEYDNPFAGQQIKVKSCD